MAATRPNDVVRARTIQDGPAAGGDDALRHPPARKAEQEWHDELFRGRNSRDAALPDAIRERYLHPGTRPIFEREFLFHLAGEVRGKRVLIVGCGDDHSPVIMALKGAEVFAFDLSAEAVAYQRVLARENSVADRVHIVQCAIEEMPFIGESFDVIWGSMILHHVPDALNRVAPGLRRVLKRNGYAVFSEPVVAMAPVQWLLDLLPGHQEISPHERQLCERDFAPFTRIFIMKKFPFNGLSRLDRFVLSGPLEYAPWWQRALVRSLHLIDYSIFRVKWLHGIAGIVAIHLSSLPVDFCL